MFHATVLNPFTNRENAVRVFPIVTREAVAIVKRDGVKALSWAILNQAEALADCEAEMAGDSAANNFALGIFEHALDWGMGLAVVAYLKSFAAQYPGRQPKTVRVAVSKGGQVFIVNAENRVLYATPS